MKYLIIQLAAISVAIDKKERLLILPVDSEIDIHDKIVFTLPTQDCLLTISYSEYEKNQENWGTYRSKLIDERKAKIDAFLTIGSVKKETV